MCLIILYQYNYLIKMIYKKIPQQVQELDLTGLPERMQLGI